MSDRRESAFPGSSVVWIVMTVIFGKSMFVYYSVFDVKVESIRIKVATYPSALGQGALLDLLDQLGIGEPRIPI